MTSSTAAAPPGAGLALYRKYRSATFAELIGQEHVTRPLSTALDRGRINHAYLFSGPRGCGKTSSARILARSLNCAQGPTSTPCGVCDSCVELAPNGPGSIDVIEIDAASHNGVDDARDLRERAWYAPVRDRFKVYIVDEAHMVTTAAFNALLKLVEEPPDFLVFVFATTEPDKVLQTIRSRTHHYPFRLVPPTILRQHLEAICSKESVTYEPAVLPLVTRAGGGSVRDSLSILDQLLAGAADDGLLYRDAVALLGVTDAALLDALVDALAAADAAGTYAAVDRVVEAGHDPRRFAADLLDRFRDLLVLDAVPDAGEKGLLDLPSDVLTAMAGQVRRLGRATVTRQAEIVHQALVEMRGTTAPRLVLELVCARMLLPDAADDAAALLARVEALERRAALGVPAGPPGSSSSGPAGPSSAPPGSPSSSSAPPPLPPRGSAAPSGSSTPAAPVATSAPAATSVPAPPPASAATWPPAASAPDAASAPAATSAPSTPDGVDTGRLRQLWTDSILPSIESKRTKALLLDAQVLDLRGTRVVVGLPSRPLAALAEADSNVAQIRAALARALGGSWDVEIAVSGETPPRPPASSGPAPNGGGPSGPAPSGPAPSGAASGNPAAPVPAAPAGSAAPSGVAETEMGGSGDAARQSTGPAATAPGTVGTGDAGGTGSARDAKNARRAVSARTAGSTSAGVDADDRSGTTSPAGADDPRDDPDYVDTGTAAAARADGTARSVDPEALAVDLLQSQLGARPLD